MSVINFKQLRQGIFILLIGLILWIIGLEAAKSFYYFSALIFVFLSLKFLIKSLIDRTGKNIFYSVIYLLIGIFWLYNYGFAALLTVVFIGIYQLFLGIVCIYNFILQYMDKAKGIIYILFRGIFHLIVGLSLFINFRYYFESNTYYKLGLYLVLLGIMYIFDALSISKKYKITTKRKFRVRLPVIFSALFPMYSLRKDNSQDDTYNADFLNKKKLASRNKTVDLEVWVHTAEKGASIAGHVDISYKGYTYSYGHYDVDSHKLFGSKGDGVLYIVKSEDYGNWLSDYHSYKGVYRYGLHLTNEQRLIVEYQISELMSNVYRYELTSKAQLESYLGDLSQKIPTRIYKFNRSRFKTYFVLTTNCVLLADTIVGKTGFDIVSVSGISSPGSYKLYLDKEYAKLYSNVITKKLYSNKCKGEN
ncbi:DUF308 domain-containing protein [Gemella sp. GH3]|uniref:DUF308 domain-containing protein n=1 Tax=unclassified Gemella TaxID=2624949 RepID=UPI0015D02DC8|nr:MULTISPECIES: DUF308 domain-containing protein [unclassified Gemella]MBF0713356.1 DUF308 domain-containing protein [Gemella sp. GH3.1]NYS50308.1 DUF308 domain-containing protein [Gemella sp. GH3]